MADAITARHSRGIDVLEKKPIPTNPQTLPQIYQRWNYQDYIAQWHALSTADKRTWHSNASRFHMTGFAYFMSYHLKHLPDLAARYHLDERAGTLAQDFSRNANHATVIGALPTVGQIDYGRQFDGVNDIATAPYIPAYDLVDNFSVQAWVYHVTQTAVGAQLKAITTRDTVFMLLVDRITDRVFFYWYPLGVPTFLQSLGALPLNQWTLITMTFESSTFISIYFGATLDRRVATPAPTQTAATALTIGNRILMNRPYLGIIDHSTLFDGVLTPEDITRHNDRGYP